MKKYNYQFLGDGVCIIKTKANVNCVYSKWIK